MFQQLVAPLLTRKPDGFRIWLRYRGALQEDCAPEHTGGGIASDKSAGMLKAAKS